VGVNIDFHELEVRLQKKKVACPHLFMLETLFGSKNRERILQFILANGEENMG